jgi:hypothetical protein
VVDDIDLMAQADIFVGGPSSFSSFLAALNRYGVIIAPPIPVVKFNDKYHGMNNTVRNRNILLGNVEDFNRMFCISLLYVDRMILQFPKCQKYYN